MRLPASVAEIADVIGRDAALYLIGQLPRCYANDNPGHGSKHRGGGKAERVILYVPKRLKPDHRLVQILGEETAAKLVEGFGGETLCPSPCKEYYRAFRDAEVRRMWAAGVSARDIADTLGLSDRQVRNIRREIPKEEMQAANDNAAGDQSPSLQWTA